MPVPRRALRRALLAPWIAAAPLGLMLCGCGASSEQAVSTAPHSAKPALLAPQVAARALDDAASAADPRWRAKSASFGTELDSGLDDEGVFRLPAVSAAAGGVLRVAQALQSETAGPQFPAHRQAPPEFATKDGSDDAENDGLGVSAPSELRADELADVQPLPAVAGAPTQPAHADAAALPALSGPIADEAAAQASAPAPPADGELANLPAADSLTAVADGDAANAEARAAVAAPLVKRTPAPWSELSGARHPAMRAVAMRAAEQVRDAFALANRGALYSAQSEFVRALRSISQALDAQHTGRTHSHALAAGLRALEESDDFVPRGARVEADLDLQSIAPAHQTPILHVGSLEGVTPLVARRRYYTYAQEQLALAAGRERAGSMALYGLAKVQTALAEQNQTEHASAGPKAMALHQAAMLADGGNYLAANELGVLLAKFGQYQQARAALIYSLNIVALPTAWHNLAVVHQQLGEAKFAALAEQQSRHLARQSSSQHLLGQQQPVIWTDPAAFARASHAHQAPLRSPAPASPAPASTAQRRAPSSTQR